MRILMLSNVVPYPPHGGVQLRVYNLLTRIAAWHDVTVGCHAWSADDVESAALLQRSGIPTVVAPLGPAGWRHVLPALGTMLAGRPPEVAQYFSPTLRDLVARGGYDVIQVEEPLLAAYVDRRRTRARTILTFHNVHHVQARRIARLEKEAWRRTWRRANARWMRHYEPRVAARVDRAIAVTDVDRRELTAAAPGLRVDVVPNGVDTRGLTVLGEQEARCAVVFVGTLGYRPCADGAEWLVRDILPRVRREMSQVEAWIVGRNAPREVEALAKTGVYVESPVADVRPYYARASVAVAPLRAGGGSRLKILEAMALGRAVVSTSLGAEGLDVRDGEHLVIADDEPSFARAIVRLLADADLRRTLTRNARRLVEAEYDWDAIAERQLRIYDELGAAC